MDWKVLHSTSTPSGSFRLYSFSETEASLRTEWMERRGKDMHREYRAEREEGRRDGK
jgi:hypothetical protein